LKHQSLSLTHYALCPFLLSAICVLQQSNERSLRRNAHMDSDVLELILRACASLPSIPPTISTNTPSTQWGELGPPLPHVALQARIFHAVVYLELDSEQRWAEEFSSSDVLGRTSNRTGNNTQIQTHSRAQSIDQGQQVDLHLFDPPRRVNNKNKIQNNKFIPNSPSEVDTFLVPTASIWSLLLRSAARRGEVDIVKYILDFSIPRTFSLHGTDDGPTMSLLDFPERIQCLTAALQGFREGALQARSDAQEMESTASTSTASPSFTSAVNRRRLLYASIIQRYTRGIPWILHRIQSIQGWIPDNSMDLLLGGAHSAILKLEAERLTYAAAITDVKLAQSVLNELRQWESIRLFQMETWGGIEGALIRSNPSLVHRSFLTAPMIIELLIRFYQRMIERIKEKDGKSESEKNEIPTEALEMNLMTSIHTPSISPAINNSSESVNNSDGLWLLSRARTNSPEADQSLSLIHTRLSELWFALSETPIHIPGALSPTSTLHPDHEDFIRVTHELLLPALLATREATGNQHSPALNAILGMQANANVDITDSATVVPSADTLPKNEEEELAANEPSTITPVAIAPSPTGVAISVPSLYSFEQLASHLSSTSSSSATSPPHIPSLLSLLDSARAAHPNGLSVRLFNMSLRALLQAAKFADRIQRLASSVESEKIQSMGIITHSPHQCFEIMQQLLAEMRGGGSAGQQQQGPIVRPDAYTYVLLVQAHRLAAMPDITSPSGSPQQHIPSLLALYEDMLTTLSAPSTPLLNTFISSFAAMESRSAGSMNELLSLQVYEAMLTHGEIGPLGQRNSSIRWMNVKPDTNTFEMMIEILCKTKQFESALGCYALFRRCAKESIANIQFNSNKQQTDMIEKNVNEEEEEDEDTNGNVFSPFFSSDGRNPVSPLPFSSNSLIRPSSKSIDNLLSLIISDFASPTRRIQHIPLIPPLFADLGRFRLIPSLTAFNAVIQAATELNDKNLVKDIIALLFHTSFQKQFGHIREEILTPASLGHRRKDIKYIFRSKAIQYAVQTDDIELFNYIFDTLLPHPSSIEQTDTSMVLGGCWRWGYFDYMRWIQLSNSLNMVTAIMMKLPRQDENKLKITINTTPSTNAIATRTSVSTPKTALRLDWRQWTLLLTHIMERNPLHAAYIAWSKQQEALVDESNQQQQQQTVNGFASFLTTEAGKKAIEAMEQVEQVAVEAGTESSSSTAVPSNSQQSQLQAQPCNFPSPKQLTDRFSRSSIESEIDSWATPSLNFFGELESLGPHSLPPVRALETFLFKRLGQKELLRAAFELERNIALKRDKERKAKKNEERKIAAEKVKAAALIKSNRKKLNAVTATIAVAPTTSSTAVTSPASSQQTSSITPKASISAALSQVVEAAAAAEAKTSSTTVETEDIASHTVNPLVESTATVSSVTESASKTFPIPVIRVKKKPTKQELDRSYQLKQEEINRRKASAAERARLNEMREENSRQFLAELDAILLPIRCAEQIRLELRNEGKYLPFRAVEWLYEAVINSRIMTIFEYSYLPSTSNQQLLVAMQRIIGLGEMILDDYSQYSSASSSLTETNKNNSIPTAPTPSQLQLYYDNLLKFFANSIRTSALIPTDTTVTTTAAASSSFSSSLSSPPSDEYTVSLVNACLPSVFAIIELMRVRSIPVSIVTVNCILQSFCFTMNAHIYQHDQQQQQQLLLQSNRNSMGMSSEDFITSSQIQDLAAPVERYNLKFRHSNTPIDITGSIGSNIYDIQIQTFYYQIIQKNLWNWFKNKGDEQYIQLLPNAQTLLFLLRTALHSSSLHFPLQVWFDCVTVGSNIAVSQYLRELQQPQQHPSSSNSNESIRRQQFPIIPGSKHIILMFELFNKHQQIKPFIQWIIQMGILEEGKGWIKQKENKFNINSNNTNIEWPVPSSISSSSSSSSSSSASASLLSISPYGYLLHESKMIHIILSLIHSMGTPSEARMAENIIIKWKWTPNLTYNNQMDSINQTTSTINSVSDMESDRDASTNALQSTLELVRILAERYIPEYISNQSATSNDSSLSEKYHFGKKMKHGIINNQTT
jgi:hypothetical protein